MELTLKRVLRTNDGITGVLIAGARELCRILEPQWKNNQKGISAIPEGTYTCMRVDTPKHGNVFQIMSVPGRTAVLFHWGNTEIDTEACLLTGMEVGEMFAQDPDTKKNESQLAVLRSKEAFEKFMTYLKNEQAFTLHIINC